MAIKFRVKSGRFKRKDFKTRTAAEKFLRKQMKTRKFKNLSISAV